MSILRSFACLIAFSTLGACGDAADAPSSSGASSSSSVPAGRFIATLGEQRYDLAVSCSDLSLDAFRFLSDKTDMLDSNGDGYLISGYQHAGSLVLTIVDHGVTYSAPRLETFEKQANGARGGGALYREADSMRFVVDFTVVCG